MHSGSGKSLPHNFLVYFFMYLGPGKSMPPSLRYLFMLFSGRYSLLYLYIFFAFRAREIALGDEGYFTFYWLNGEHKIGKVPQRITINEPVDYMVRAVMILMQGKDITQAIERDGLKVEPVLGPEIVRATASVIWAQHRRDFQPNPSNGPSSLVFLCKKDKIR